MAKPVKKVNPERKRAQFTKEFKLEAVRLLNPRKPDPYISSPPANGIIIAVPT